MQRRQFLTSAVKGAGGVLLPAHLTLSLQAADPIDIKVEEARFGYDFKSGKLTIDAKDVTIDGLTIPKFTWGWIGLTVAQGVLSAFGGAVFGALVSAIFGGGKSIEQLLKEQLAEIARIVEEKLQDNDLRNYQARVSALVHLFEEYNNDPTQRRLDHLAEKSAESLAEIQSLGFKGYRTFMSASGLRMTILQEVIKKRDTSGTRKNLELQKEKAIAFHDEMIALINKQTEPASHPLAYQNFLRPFYILPPTNILGHKVDGWVPALEGPKPMPISDITKVIEADKKNPEFRDIKWVHWEDLRAKIKAQNTNLGEKIVTRWLGQKR